METNIPRFQFANCEFYLTEASLLILPDLLISWPPSSGSSDELLLSRLLKLNFRETPDEDLTEDIEKV